MNEEVKTIYLDMAYDQMYVILDVNQNTYQRRPIFEPGEDPGMPNPNIAVSCYSFDFGNRVWTTLIGDPVYPDSFSGLALFGDFLYAVVTTHTDTYSNDPS